jgi:hypothetical protein
LVAVRRDRDVEVRERGYAVEEEVEPQLDVAHDAVEGEHEG